MKLIDKLKDKISPKQPTKHERTILVHMQDGSVEEYPQRFYITDKINCVVCMGKYYHTSLNCDRLEWEREHSSNPVKGMYIKDAKAQKITYCDECSRDDYLIRHGREDELE